MIKYLLILGILLILASCAYQLYSRCDYPDSTDTEIGIAIDLEE